MKFFRNEKSDNLYSDCVPNKDAAVAIIFLHGLVGSRRYWDETYRDLAKQYSLYFVDLLGFGLSAKPATTYSLQTHTQALRIFISQKVKEKKIILVGHSLGAIIALSYLSRYPEQIEKVVLISLPYFHSYEEATTSIKSSTKPQYFVVDSLATRLTCTLWCYLGGPLTRRIIPFILRNHPKAVASDSLLHTYNSYISTLYNVVYRQDIPSLISHTIKKRITLIHGAVDTIAPVAHVQELATQYHLHLIVLPGQNHPLPRHAKESIKQLLQKQISL